jgi:hypothetical protein
MVTIFMLLHIFSVNSIPEILTLSSIFGCKEGRRNIKLTAGTGLEN